MIKRLLLTAALSFGLLFSSPVSAFEQGCASGAKYSDLVAAQGKDPDQSIDGESARQVMFALAQAIKQTPPTTNIDQVVVYRGTTKDLYVFLLRGCIEFGILINSGRSA